MATLAEMEPGPTASIPDNRPLPEIIAFLNRARLSGTLEITAEAGCRSLRFSEGALRSVRSIVEEEKLGSWLVGSGVISEDLMAIGLLAQLEHSGALLGSTLVGKGHLSQRSLDQSLEQLTVAIIERATADRRIDIVFRQGNEGGGPETVVIATTSQLILASARMVGSQKAHRRRLGSLHRPVRLSRPLADFRRELELTDNELALLGAVEGSYFTSLEELTPSLPFGSRELLSTAYNLVVAGLLLFHDLPAEQEQPLPCQRPGHRQRSAGSPEQVLLNLDRAGKLVEIGNVTGAIRLLEDLFAEEGQPQYLLAAVRIMVREGAQGALILATLRRVLEADQQLVEGWLELAGYWRRRGVTERERTALGRALALAPDHRQARTRLQVLGA